MVCRKLKKGKAAVQIAEELEEEIPYEGWTDEASRMLIACDSELQDLCHVIPMDIKTVKSLKLHYESSTTKAMTAKIRGIEAFKGLTSPMKQTSDGWVPDFESRYFVADFSYGLKIIKDMARLFEVETPHIDEVWNWYEEVSRDRNFFSLDYSDKREFVQLYHATNRDELEG